MNLLVPLHVVGLFASLLPLCLPCKLLHAELRVGAAKVDVTPTQLPVLVNGGMRSRTVELVTTRVYARAIVLDDGRERIGLCVVDSCMLSRALCDEAKQLAAARGSLRPERIMVSATHTHSAPSSVGALGTDADANYVPFLRQKIAEALVAAESRLEPAEVGWGSGPAPEYTALRRWVRRPDRVAVDPFGNPTVRATMHAARDLDDAIGPTGPEDPELSMIAFRNRQGRCLAVLCNFSMHYFGSQPGISSDYFGLFCQRLEESVRLESPPNADALDAASTDVVAIMSHGCSGDIWRRDYMRPENSPGNTMQEYTLGLLNVAQEIYADVAYQSDADLSMLETNLPLAYRVPDEQRLAWANRVVESMGDRLPETQPEIYAREQILLHKMRDTELVLQAIRIGDIAIATTPNETYALSGLKLKLQSPLRRTMVIELANGGEGYIPPPEQHLLGGYNTWPARSAGLEVQAEPKIVERLLQQLEQVAGKPRRVFRAAEGPATKHIASQTPFAYWRLHEMQGPVAKDCSGNQRHAVLEPGILFFLEGPQDEFAENTSPSHQQELNRAAHFAGGRLVAHMSLPSPEFSIALSIWNGMPRGARPIAGWFFSQDYPAGISAHGIHLGLDEKGCLILQVGERIVARGKTSIGRWQWKRVGLVRNEQQIQVFLKGTPGPGNQCSRPGNNGKQLFFLRRAKRR